VAGASPEWVWFQTGDKQLHLTVDEHNAHPAAHFALEVEDFERLRACDTHIEQASPLADRRRLFVRDPANNRIELIVYSRSSDEL
jgi:hypothetical protein